MDDTGNNVFDSLPEELLGEILVRLPCSKSATKCKVVAKRWLSLISSPNFIDRFIRKHEADTNSSRPCWLIIRPRLVGFSKGQLVYPQGENGNSGISSTRFLPPLLQSRMPSYQGAPLKVVATCNDLILCEEDDQEHPYCMYICNAQTMQWVALPRPPCSYPRCCAGLACHLDYGYSVVLLKLNCETFFNVGGVKNLLRIEAFVFSTYNGKWKEVMLVSPKPFDAYFHTCRSILYDGMMFFYNNENGMIGINSIITVDEKGIDEQYNCLIDCDFVDWPPLEPPCYDIPEVAVCICQGKLRLARKDRVSVTIWDFLNSGSTTTKWQLKHKIFLPANFVVHVDLFGFDPSNDSTLYCCRYDTIVSLDLETKQRHDILTIPDESRTMGLTAKHFDSFRPFWLILQCWPTPVLGFSKATRAL